MTAPAPTAPTAIVLAGERPGGDPLAQAHGVAAKGLIRIGGEAMLSRVVRALAADDGFARIVVLAQHIDPLRDHPDCAWMADDPRIGFALSSETIAATIAARIAADDAPLCITTADNALLTPAMIAYFIAAARNRDVAIAMVERRVHEAAYPGAPRTWLRFRSGSWSGANLFWISGRSALPLIGKWRAVEQDRKKGWRVIAAFGPLLLIGALLRLITLPVAIARAGRRQGIDAVLVAMPQAAACIDVDKPADIALAEAIVAARGD